MSGAGSDTSIPGNPVGDPVGIFTTKPTLPPSPSVCSLQTTLQTTSQQKGGSSSVHECTAAGAAMAAAAAAAAAVAAAEAAAEAAAAAADTEPDEEEGSGSAMRGMKRSNAWWSSGSHTLVQGYDKTYFKKGFAYYGKKCCDCKQLITAIMTRTKVETYFTVLTATTGPNTHQLTDSNDILCSGCVENGTAKSDEGTRKRPRRSRQ